MRLVFSSAVAMAAVLALIYADVGQAVDTFVTLATYHDYDLAKHGWKLTPELVCSKWHSGESIEWGAKYGWVAFCLPDLQPIGPDFCGQCVQIQSQETGHTITARIVDQCTRPESGLVLDYKTVFEPLDDKTGRGKRFGSIFVTYQFVNDNTIALRNLENNMLCTRYTNGIVDGLNANQSQISIASHLTVTELVTSRRIEGIKFHVSDSWVDNTRTRWNIVLNSGEEVSNDTMKPQTLKVKIPYKDTRTSTWRSTTPALKIGPAVEIYPVEIPQVTGSYLPTFSFTIEMTSPPFEPSYVWGGEESSVEPQAVRVHELVVEPMTKVTLSLRAASVTCVVPLTYTRYDVLDETSGKEEAHVLEDGMYIGTNYANFEVNVSMSQPINKI